MTGKAHPFRTTAGLIAAIGICSMAPAQQPADQWTIEALAAQAHVIIRGKVTEILTLDAPPLKPGGPPRVSLMLTVRTLAKVKGRPDSWMTLVRDTDASDTRYEMWKKAATEMLWVVFSEDDPKAYPAATIGPGLGLQPGQAWVALHETPPDPAEIALDPTAGQGIFSVGLSVIKDGKEKEDAIKRFVASNPDITKVCRLSVPPSVAGAVGFAGVQPHIVVPVTPDLEAIALKMIATPEAFLPKGHTATDAVWVRSAGVSALSNFSSPKNTAVLTPLLKDAGKGPTNVTDTPVKTYYWVRLAAYNTLAGWGVKVAKPPL